MSTRPTGSPCWIDLYTSDTDRAGEFYGALLGWTAEAGDPQYGGYINFLKDGVPVAGCMANDGTQGQPDTWSVYLDAADIAATAAAVPGAGGRVDLAPMDVMDLGKMAVYGDPGGDTVGAWQAGTHKGFGVTAAVGAPSWFELHTTEYDAAVTFYEKVFGWQPSVASDSPGFRYTTLGPEEEATAGIMDATVLDENQTPGWSIYFGVADTDAALVRAAELDGSVIRPAEDTPFGRLATVADPLGTTFKLVSVQ